MSKKEEKKKREDLRALNDFLTNVAGSAEEQYIARLLEEWLIRDRNYRTNNRIRKYLEGE